MLKFKKNCKICNLVREDRKLLKRIYECGYYVPGSSDSLLAISRDNVGRFSYQGLKNHAKQHQFIDSEAYTNAMLQKQDEKAQKVAIRKAVKAADAVQTVINRGNERLENGEIDVETADLLRASQIKINQEAKEKDQQLAILDMMAHFISGEALGDPQKVDSSKYGPVIDQT